MTVLATENTWINVESLLYHGTRILVAIGIIICARIISGIISKLINRRKKKQSLYPLNETQLNIIKLILKVVIYFLAIISILFTIPQLKGLGTTLFAGAGIATFVITYASQSAFSNIISGIFIFMSKPFKVGDRIEISGKAYGIVEEIALRHTIIRNFYNQRIVIPNSKIGDETLINYDLADTTIRTQVVFGIAYESDHNYAIQLIKEAIFKHRFYYDHREEKPPFPSLENSDIIIRMINWGDSSIDLKAYFWNRNQSEGFEMKCDLLKSLKETFEKEGIDIPYPHRTILNKK